jgi:hypothetical protein
MSCEAALAALGHMNRCELTDAGARIATHCLYPSFEPVYVFVAKLGDGFHVHDGEGAYLSAWAHGRDESLIRREIKAEASRFRLHVSNRSLAVSVTSTEWLASGILAVANASAFAARSAIAKLNLAAEEALFAKIEHSLSRLSNGRLHKEVEIKGKSGGTRRFDFAILGGLKGDIYINGVSPHHGSVAAKFVAFADTEVESTNKLAVFDRQLNTDDAALLQQVSTVVPLKSVLIGAERALSG